MRIQVNRVEDSPAFPQRVDVVVIGAGIVGASTAYELAHKGLAVALLEKGIVAGEQSGRNWGWVRQQNRALHELPLAMYSLRRWGELGQEIGADLGFRRTGCLYVTKDEAELARWEAWNAKARAMGFHNVSLTQAEARERMKGSTTPWIGGLWSPTDGRGEPGMAAPAIVEGAKALGVSLHQTCAVRGLDIANGQVKGVWTERGLIRVAYEREDHTMVLESLADKVSPRILRAPGRLDRVVREVTEYFAGTRRVFDVPLDFTLTSGFRLGVLEHLTHIAYGRTESYAQVAAAAGTPRAVRAVGSACATNPLPVVVPCHRVIRSDGTLGGYAGGPDAKRLLLTLEGSAA